MNKYILFFCYLYSLAACMNEKNNIQHIKHELYYDSQGTKNGMKTYLEGKEVIDYLYDVNDNNDSMLSAIFVRFPNSRNLTFTLTFDKQGKILSINEREGIDTIYYDRDFNPRYHDSLRRVDDSLVQYIIKNTKEE